MSGAALNESLPCGESLDALFEQVAAGGERQRTRHQRTCQHCTVALNDAGQVWMSIRAIAGQPVHMPPALVGTIMDSVQRRADAGWFGVSGTSRGLTRVSAKVIAAIARAAATRISGVARVRYSWSELIGTVLTPAPGTAVQPSAPEAVAVEVDITTEYGEPIDQIAAAVRRTITRDVGRLAGVAVERIDVEVSDVDSAGGSKADA